MKYRFLAMLAVTSLFILISSTAALATDFIIFHPGDELYLTNYNLLDGAGVMTYQVTHVSDDGTTKTIDPQLFTTFCIQDNVYIYPSKTYYVGNISDTVGFLNMAPAGTGELNYIVDYLFTQYARGAYAAEMNHSNSALALEYQADFQRLLWSLQGTGAPYAPDSSLQKLPLGLPWDSVLLNPPANQAYNTVVLNLTTGFDYTNHVGTGSDVQNMLADPPDVVPEPTSLLLLGSGLIALGWTVRRRK